MKIAVIVAMASNRAIGLNGQMPWHLSEDLKRFKRLTLGSPIIMGRKTFESIGRPLPGRTNIIISRNPDYQAEGCLVFGSLQTALSHADALSEQAFVIGGAGLYASALPLADELFLTEIHQAFMGDTFFPAWDEGQWREAAREDISDDPQVPFRYSFIKLVRVAR